MPDQYPKMLTVAVGRKIVPLVFKKGHVRHGEHVIVHSLAEERAIVSTELVPESAVVASADAEDVYWDHAHGRVTGR